MSGETLLRKIGRVGEATWRTRVVVMEAIEGCDGMLVICNSITRVVGGFLNDFMMLKCTLFYSIG
jgi:hypothetical protein